MNKDQEKLERSELLSLLSQCTEPQQMMFKRMYCHLDLGVTIEEAVQLIDFDKIQHAKNQCQKSILNNQSNGRKS